MGKCAAPAPPDPSQAVQTHMDLTNYQRPLTFSERHPLIAGIAASGAVLLMIWLLCNA